MGGCHSVKTITRICKNCGKEMTLTANQVLTQFCPDCKQLSHTGHVRYGSKTLDYDLAEKKRQNLLQYEIIHDPAEYPLLPGLKLQKIELDMGLAIESYTEGTIIQHIKSRVKYIVKDQKLERME